jgi:diguanylate cyclase (GGDEF)-like protein
MGVERVTVSTASIRDDRRRMGRAAALAGPGLAIVIPVTMPFVGYSHDETLAFYALIVPIVLTAGVVGWFLPWHRWPDIALLAIPLTGFVWLSALGLASDGRASVYGGYIPLVFLFIGLTQRIWTSVAVLPLAVTTTLLLYGGPSNELVARLPISVIVWLTSAQIVARYRARNREVVDDLETQAHRDPLTGLGNRNGLERRLAAMRPGDAALLVDLDHFKRINDNAGHTAGDQVLRDFGALVRTVLRGRDYAIRYGGEEILILLPGSGASGAQRLDTRLREAWAQAQPAVTYSAGIAVVVEGLRPVVARADEAMYAAKARGRNRTVAHDGSVVSLVARPDTPNEPMTASASSRD